MLLYYAYDHFFTSMPLLLLSAEFRTISHAIFARSQAFRQICIDILLLLTLPEALKRGTVVFVPSQHHLRHACGGLLLWSIAGHACLSFELTHTIMHRDGYGGRLG